MNKVILMGRLTGDVETRKTQDGGTVARFRLAVDRRGRKTEGRQNADFVPVVAWDKLAEFAGQCLGKGKKIALVGHITSGSYQKDGGTVYTLDVTADEIEFAESKAAEQSRQQRQPETAQYDEMEYYDDPPF